MNKINVVAAAITNESHQILCFQRGPGRALEGLWEFPGGKIEEGETPEAALIREIQEELNSQLTIIDYIDQSSYVYDFGRVTMKVYLAQLKNNSYTLTEHTQAKWINRENLMSLDWAPVDIPIAKKLVEKNKS